MNVVVIATIKIVSVAKMTVGLVFWMVMVILASWNLHYINEYM